MNTNFNTWAFASRLACRDYGLSGSSNSSQCKPIPTVFDLVLLRQLY